MKRRVAVSVAALVLAASALLSACREAPEAPATVRDVFTGVAGDWVDLTHPFDEETIYWPTARPFELEEVDFGETGEGYFYASYHFAAAEHGGTHLDAPIHFFRGGATVGEIDLYRLIGPAVVVDTRERMGPDSRVRLADLEVWEGRNGPIPDRAILLLRTGWSERWPDRERYLGTDASGPDAVSELHFPGLHPDAARWLVENRNVGAVGIDTPSLDYGRSSDFRTHRILAEAGIPGFENLARLDALPEQGSFVVALPMNIREGSGAPLRVAAFVPRETDAAAASALTGR